MKKLLLILLFLPYLMLAQTSEKPLSSRIASYDIQVTLDANEKTLTANEVLHWTNPSQDTIHELRFHVYLNAFKNNQSTYLSGGGGFGAIGKEYDEECLWGWTDIQKITDEYGNDLTAKMSYIQPDDDNKEDRTVLQVPLQQAVMPGGKIDLTLEWEAKIPKTISRTGYAKEFFFLVQWFPKVGVYEPAGMRFSEKGNWNCHQYHAQTEYYSDFGLYNVDITVPSDFEVGASGVLVDKKEIGNQTTHSYRANDVIDFAWSASPKFVEFNDKWESVDLRLLTYEDRAVFAPRIFDAAKNTLEYLDDFVGKYPYSTLTVVAPPFHGLRSGAMEYPTLVTTFTMNGLPDGMLSTETLTIHEMVHQYFMQMLATNEQEEAWLDEGFTSYFEAKIMDKYYEGFFYDSYFDIRVGSQELRRGRFFGADNIKLQPLSATTYKTNGGSHREISYGKTAVMLWTLEGLLGEKMMREIIQTYFEGWKFKHPCGDDFMEIATEIIERNCEPEFANNVLHFLYQAVQGTEVCDYAIVGIRNSKAEKKRGIFEQNTCIEDAENEQSTFKNKVIIHRLGEMQVPIEIQMTYENGETILEKWDGQSRIKVFEYQSNEKIIKAEIDPERKIFIDKNFINNSRTLQPEGKGIAKTTRTFFTWLQNLLTSVSLLV
ncbi:MAG: hypothetical protein ACI85O_000749 [Saprospiraceae bacterium]|jgi:hypothetical protein